MGHEDHDEPWQDTSATPPTPRRPHHRAPETSFEASPRITVFHPLVLILAAAIGAALIALIAQSYLDSRARAAAEEVVRANTEAARQAQLQAEERLRQEALQRQARQAEQDRLEALRVQAARERQQQDDAAKQAELDEAARKERAWVKFYRRPRSCDDGATIECANAYIKAKREFEAKYARGEL